MRIELTKENVEYPDGLEIGIAGFKSNPADADAYPSQVYIEFYEGKLLVHVWNGTSQDPQTVSIDTLAPAPGSLTRNGNPR